MVAVLVLSHSTHYKPYRSITAKFLDENFRYENHFFVETKILAMVLLMVPLFMAFVYYQGAPFKQPIYKNLKVLGYLSFCSMVLFLTNFGDFLFEKTELEHFLIKVTNFPDFSNQIRTKVFILSFILLSIFALVFKMREEN